MDSLRFDPEKKDQLDSLERRKLLPADKLLNLLPIEKNHVVLDLGAGTGYFTIPVSHMTQGTVYALDIESEMLDHLKGNIQDQHISNIQLLEASVAEIPLPNNSIDIIIASLVLHAVKPLSAGLSEIVRVMKEGAHILCFDWDTKDSPIGPEMGIRVSSSDMEKALTDAGLTVMKHVTPTEYLYIFIAKK
ncbi:Methyltransferase domain-containing protein [Paenibacillus catalpae]|uniref:Methyltransferase domain-containing protein n=1 Tax=Paenibacillus catalpae TaxID=1045775 RepID=A0A1I1X5Z2_9BACL|nr:class I SAM-dependent methyltransferase [Paenibacillus catalpae]SFE02835.1 Methyltransferase domain-containing protein [Paenibacillus catalpae]